MTREEFRKLSSQFKSNNEFYDDRKLVYKLKEFELVLQSIERLQNNLPGMSDISNLVDSAFSNIEKAYKLLQNKGSSYIKEPGRM